MTDPTPITGKGFETRAFMMKNLLDNWQNRETIFPPNTPEDMKRKMIEDLAESIAGDAVNLFPHCIMEIERLHGELADKVAENTRIRQEVARIMVALNRGELTVTFELMNEFYRILGLEPPKCRHCGDGPGPCIHCQH